MKKFEYTTVPVESEEIAEILVDWKKFLISEMNNIIIKYCSREEMEILESLRPWDEGDISKIIETNQGTLSFRKTSKGVIVSLTKEEGFLIEKDNEFDWDEYKKDTQPEPKPKRKRKRDLQYAGDAIDIPKLFNEFGVSSIDGLLCAIGNHIDWLTEKIWDGFDEESNIFHYEMLSREIVKYKDYLIKKFNL